MIAAVVVAAVVDHPVVAMAEVASVRVQCPVEASAAIMIAAAMAEVGTVEDTAEIGTVAASTMIAVAALGSVVLWDRVVALAALAVMAASGSALTVDGS